MPSGLNGAARIRCQPAPAFSELLNKLATCIAVQYIYIRLTVNLIFFYCNSMHEPSLFVRSENAGAGRHRVREAPWGLGSYTSAKSSCNSVALRTARNTTSYTAVFVFVQQLYEYLVC